MKYAVPLYSGGAWSSCDGTYQAVTVIGLDDTASMADPSSSGKIEDIYAEKASSPSTTPSSTNWRIPTIGTEFELNDHRGVIVGIAKVASSGLFGVPTLYTTYNRALQYIPNTRFTTSYVLVEPKTPADIRIIQQRGRHARLSRPHQG